MNRRCTAKGCCENDNDLSIILSIFNTHAANAERWGIESERWDLMRNSPRYRFAAHVKINARASRRDWIGLDRLANRQIQSEPIAQERTTRVRASDLQVRLRSKGNGGGGLRAGIRQMWRVWRPFNGLINEWNASHTIYAVIWGCASRMARTWAR